jgi:hypothetical protein
MNIHFALQQGFTVTLDEITSEEFNALRIFEIERAEYDREKDAATAAKNHGH